MAIVRPEKFKADMNRVLSDIQKSLNTEIRPHGRLVQRACKWLRNHGYISMPEISSTTCYGEIPDAFGYSKNGTCVVECKTSRADFFADKKKRFRITPELGMGDTRYFMAPKGVLNPEDIPEGWGLLEVCGKVVRVRKEAVNMVGNRKAEMGLIYSVFSRLERNGMLVEDICEAQKKIDKMELAKSKAEFSLRYHARRIKVLLEASDG